MFSFVPTTVVLCAGCVEVLVDSVSTGVILVGVAVLYSIVSVAAVVVASVDTVVMKGLGVKDRFIIDTFF